MKINLNISLLAVGALFSLLGFQKCSNDSFINDLISDKEKESSFHRKRDSINLAKINYQAVDIVEMNQAIVDQSVLSLSLQIELEEYRSASLVETRILSRIDTLRISMLDTVVVNLARLSDSNCFYADSLIKEFKKKKKLFNFSDEWFSINGRSSYKEVLFDSISFRNEFDIILGSKKSKWYKRRNPVVELKSYSPYSKISYVNNIVVKDKRSSFEKTMTSKPAMIIYGLIAGVVIMKKN